ncbi:MAG TPA: hypothetical protein VM686_30240 [Polyangiaceae bacterium]|nr:hypothetical protein [Polyangiaceae bacterium]
MLAIAHSLERLLPGALVAFADRRLRQRMGARFGLLYAIGIGLSYGFLILLAAGGDDDRAARALIVRELGTATWVVAGLIGLSLAADWKRLDDGDGVLGLLRLRGLPAESLELARCYAAARRIAVLVLLPTLLGCAVAGARIRSLGSAGELVALALAAAVYAHLVGAGASALALVARLLAPGSGRMLLLALVLLPHLARELWPSMPSVPAAVSWLLAAVGRAGGVGA